MKIKKLFMISVLMMFIVFMFAGCTTDPSDIDEPEFTYYTITFETQTSEEIEPQEVLENNIVVRPTTPSRENFTFIGWYTTSDAISENLWNFEENRVHESFTLYAGWKPLDDIESTESLTYELINNSYTVTGVGDETYIIIPATYNELPVTRIGEAAFARKDITDVILPDSIIEIGLNAFNNCDVLENVYLSETSALTTISNNAFSGNSSLLAFYLPKGVESIGDAVFNNCSSIERFTVSQDNNKYSSEGGHLIEKATNTLIRGSNNGIIPEGVTILSSAAFRKSKVTTIELPASLETIENYVFDDCDNLTQITVKENNATYASYNGVLYNKALTELLDAPTCLRGEIELPETLSVIPQFAFDGRKEITSIIIPEGSLERISNFSFRNTTLTIKYMGSEEKWNTITKAAVWGGDGLEIVFNYMQQPQEEKDILVVYFTRTKNTENVATIIANTLGADIVQIVPEVAYIEDYDSLISVAREELRSNARPAISEATLEQIDMDKYDTVFIGYPIWHGAEPMIIRSFIDEYDGLASKTVLPFSTSASSGGGTAYNNINDLCDDTANVPSYLHFTTNTISNAQSLVDAWIEQLNLSNSNSVEGRRVKMSFASNEIYLTLIENSATIDLVNRLKNGNITLAFRDYASSEKIADIDPELDVSNTEGYDPTIGDVTIYTPWGNIAIFYVDTSAYSTSLVLLGSIEGSGIDLLKQQTGQFEVVLSLE